MHSRYRWVVAVCGMTLWLALSGCALFGEQPLPPDDTAGPDVTPTGDEETQPPPTETPAPFKTELVICMADDPDSLVPYSSPAADALLRLVTLPAVVFGEDYTADESPLLVSLPDVGDETLYRNEDSTLAVVLRYRDDLVWSDGTPFTVADALLGLSLPASSYGPTSDVLDVQQVDDYTLEVTLADGAEYPYVPSQPPLPVHILGQTVDPSTISVAQMMSPALGPYALQVIGDDQSITFQANPHYSGADSLIPIVRVRFVPDPAQIIAELLAGGCDVIVSDGFSTDQLLPFLDLLVSSHVRAQATPGYVYDQVIFNTYTGPFGRIPYFADERVRQAFAYAFDRAALASTLFRAAVSPLDSWIPPGHWAYPDQGVLTSYPYDPTSAAALLDQAGWSDLDGDGTREYHGVGGVYACQRGEWSIEEGTVLAPTLIIPAGDSLREQIADKLRADLAPIGVALQVQPVDPSLMFDQSGPLTYREFDMALLAAVTRPDPGGISRWVGVDVYRHPLDLTAVHRWQLEDRWLEAEQLVERLALSNVPVVTNNYQGQNYGGWCHDEANIAIVEANLALSLAERQSYYASQQAVFAREVPVIPLFYRPRVVASTAYLCGIRPGPYDPIMWNIASWYFDRNAACAR